MNEQNTHDVKIGTDKSELKASGSSTNKGEQNSQGGASSNSTAAGSKNEDPIHGTQGVRGTAGDAGGETTGNHKGFGNNKTVDYTDYQGNAGNPGNTGSQGVELANKNANRSGSAGKQQDEMPDDSIHKKLG
ncbi:MAG: hypothetical protein V4443_06070 [Pseudomonadota bacterium]